MDEKAVYTKKISDLLDGFDLVDKHTRPAFIKTNNHFTDVMVAKHLKYGLTKNNSFAVSGSAIYLIDIVTFVLCGVLLMQCHITAGIVVAALTYAQYLLEPVQEILYCINTINGTRDIVKEFDTMLTEVNNEVEMQVSDPAEVVTLNDLSVDFDNKVLTYNVDFTVGKKYMIIGESGSGKSTLLNALMSRYHYTGSIEIDGLSGHLDTNNVFYLTQHQHVFSESFKANATIFDTFKLPDEKMLNTVPLYHKIREAQDCTKLSSGEQQVMKICRMLAQNKPFIIVDEPFSSIDAANRKKLFHMLTETDATVILVSHDLDFKTEDLDQWTLLNVKDICHETKL